MSKETREINEGGEQIEDLQRKIRSDLYDETLDISDENRREKIDDLHDKTIDFSNTFWTEDLNLMRFDFASVCC